MFRIVLSRGKKASEVIIDTNDKEKAVNAYLDFLGDTYPYLAVRHLDRAEKNWTIKVNGTNYQLQENIQSRDGV